MRKFLTHRITRAVAWVTMVTTTTLMIPPGAFAKPLPEPGDVGINKYQKLSPEMQEKVRANQNKPVKQPDVRALTASEMRSAMGRGQYRNKYLCGIAPWQRDFHGVNTSTGNLFKSFTDMQVAASRGAALAMQRTYNSQDDRVGPFGVGWTHCYDIRVQEAGSDNVDDVDFFGKRQVWHRDADGLYTPPPHCTGAMKTDYNTFLVNGPTDAADDVVTEQDGTVKHYIKDGTERVCDWIEDRHGNRTTLLYNQTATMSDGSQKQLLTRVTDPSGRQLNFTWTDLAPATHVWRITQINGPMYNVSYEYYGTGNLDRAYNLWKVHLDPTGLNRTTTYDYTDATGTNGTEYSLLSSVTDPAGHAATYQYNIPAADVNPTGMVWVSSLTEPAGVDANNNARTITWQFLPSILAAGNGWSTSMIDCLIREQSTLALGMQVISDPYCRQTAYYLDVIFNPMYENYYDAKNNVTTRITTRYGSGTTLPLPACPQPMAVKCTDTFTYGLNGRMLTHNVNGTRVETVTYYDESKYFGKWTSTDALNRVTTWEYFDENDANPGNRGEVKWVRDARYSQTNKEYDYTYNTYGQKLTETNLRDVVTQYAYADTWGNLTQVVQDYGTGKLNRTTDMTYDAAGHVLTKIDPNRWQSTMTYNVLGQPATAYFPAVNGQPAETITYTYGSNGRLESVQDNRGTTSLAYETGSDRVASVTDPVTGTLSYKYTLCGSVASKTLPGGGAWTYAYYDSAAQKCLSKDDPNSATEMLQKVTDDQGRIVEYVSDFSGALHTLKFNETFDGNGILQSYCKVDYVWDNVSDPAVWNALPASRFQTRMVRNTWNWKVGQTWQSRVLSQNDYTYNDMGMRLTNVITDQNGIARTEQYSYDELYRLTSVNYGDGQTQAYTFDAMSNRLTKDAEAYTYNNANMLLTRGGLTYTNDSNGNTLTGGGRTNTWDSHNRLRQCVYNGNTSVFIYGADGLRRRTVANGVTTDYIIDESTVVRERRGGSNTATYFAGLYKRDDTNGTVRWYACDDLGSVLAEVAPDGTVTASRKYDVYGLVRSGDAGISRHKFVGKHGHVSEDETGLIYMRARYMDPALGRFASEDPSGEGHNWYEYCSSNPVSLSDADGRSIASAFAWLGIGTVFIIAAIEVMQTPGRALFKYANTALGLCVLAVLCYATGFTGIESPTWMAHAGNILGAIAGLMPVIMNMVKAYEGIAKKVVGANAVAWTAISCSFAYGLLLAGAIGAAIAAE